MMIMSLKSWLKERERKQIKGEMRYCLNCKKNVKPQSTINWIVFLLLLIFTFGTFGIIYLIVSYFNKRCPICKARNWK